MISLKGKTVLVVDDEAGYREVYGAEFQMADATVLFAENGVQAFKIVQAQKVDAIISDLRMPGGSGVDLLDQVKAINPSTPVVMLITGFSDLSSEDAYDKGAEAIFSKPCDLDLLVESVYRALLSEHERWVHSFDDLPSDFKVELACESLGYAVSKARLLSLGRGGMFVAMETSQPQVGTRVSFRVALGSSPEFRGVGVCRWSRANSDPDSPCGMGIEFQNITEESLQTLSNLLKQFNPRAFIPKKLAGSVG